MVYVKITNIFNLQITFLEYITAPLGNLIPCFLVMHRVYLQASSTFRPLKMRLPCYLETSGTSNHTSRRHIPAETRPQLLCGSAVKQILRHLLQSKQYTLLWTQRYTATTSLACSTEISNLPKTSSFLGLLILFVGIL